MTLLDCVKETDADIVILTETWLRDEEVEGLRLDLSKGTGLGLLARNREANSNGVCYGGVAVLWREALGLFGEVRLKNPQRFEVLVVAGSVKGHRRKLVIVAAYRPPGYDKHRGKGALEYVEEVIIEVKRRYVDPFIVMAGDFNHWKIVESLSNFVDIEDVRVGNTRGSRSIARVFLNVSRSVVESGTLLPLETEGEETRRSDHLIVFCKVLLNRQETYRWESYSYRHFNDRSVEKFREWIVIYDWAEVLGSVTADEKAEAYQRTVVDAVERFFPLRTVKKRVLTLPGWTRRRRTS